MLNACYFQKTTNYDLGSNPKKIFFLPRGQVGVKNLNKLSIFSWDRLSKNIQNVMLMIDTDNPQGNHPDDFVTNVAR